MKILHRELPAGERKRFIVKIGKKIKIKNSLYDKPNNPNNNKKPKDKIVKKKKSK